MNNINFSIFYNQAEWYKLISEISDYFVAKKIDLFISVSYLRGPHIELSLNSTKGFAPNDSQFFFDYFKALLKSHPSSNQNLKSIGNIMFLDAPNNTLHCGIHKYDLSNDISCASELYEIHKEVSSIAIQIILEYDSEFINMETEIILEIFIVYILVLKDQNMSSLDIIKELAQIESQKYDDEILSSLVNLGEENFNANKNFLTNYFQSVLQDNGHSSGPIWLIMWQSLLLDLKTDSTNFKRFGYTEPNYALRLLLKKLNFELIIPSLIMIERGIE